MISNNTKVGIIIQARMGSTRLPAKIMMLINNKPILKYQIERLSVLGYPLVIATTTGTQDDIIEEFALANELLCFRGDEDDVLKRYYDCADNHNLHTVVRLTSDCPLIDAELINEGISRFLLENNENLYLSNTLERTYPRGADFEIFSFLLLKQAHENAAKQSEREHVTPYIWNNDLVKVIQIKHNQDHSKYRLTLDTQEDFDLIKILIEEFKADKLNIAQICDIMVNHPALHKINQHIEQKKI